MALNAYGAQAAAQAQVPDGDMLKGWAEVAAIQSFYAAADATGEWVQAPDGQWQWIPADRMGAAIKAEQFMQSLGVRAFIAFVLGALAAVFVMDHTGNNAALVVATWFLAGIATFILSFVLFPIKQTVFENKEIARMQANQMRLQGPRY